MFPGRMLLKIVTVHHTLMVNHIARYEFTVLKMQGIKDKKYAGVAARRADGFLRRRQLGLGGGAVQLVSAIGEEGQRWSAGTSNSGLIERQLLVSVAVAVQRGKALLMLSGFTPLMGRLRPEQGS